MPHPYLPLAAFHGAIVAPAHSIRFGGMPPPFAGSL
jgi:hypothetical protein